MNFFKRIYLLFTYGKELDQVLKEKRQELLKIERENNKHRLNLCYKHRQEPYFSHYSEDNCDYCKLLKKLKQYENKQD